MNKRKTRAQTTAKTLTANKARTTINTQSTKKAQTATATHPQSRAVKPATPVAAPSSGPSPAPRGKRTRRIAVPVPATAAPITAVRRPSKLATNEALVRRLSGAAITELISVTGWQSHSVRAALTGLRKQGLALTREPGPTGHSVYRVTPEQGQGGA